MGKIVIQIKHFVTTCQKFKYNFVILTIVYYQIFHRCRIFIGCKMVKTVLLNKFLITRCQNVIYDFVISTNVNVPSKCVKLSQLPQMSNFHQCCKIWQNDKILNTRCLYLNIILLFQQLLILLLSVYHKFPQISNFLLCCRSLNIK